MFARVGASNHRNVFVELLLIVIGISIALWFEGMAEDYRENRLAEQYLHGLHDDLQTDIALLDDLVALNERRIAKLEANVTQINTMVDASAEEQIELIFTPSSYHFFQPADFTYVSMQESGDFRLLTDPDIKRELLRLMRVYEYIDTVQINFIQALDDGYIPLMMASFDMLEFRLVDENLPQDPRFRNFFAYSLQDTAQRLQALKDARTQAAELQRLIDLQSGS